MKNKYLALILFISLSATAAESSLIVCEPQNKNDTSATGIWPEPYLSKDKLCLNIQADSGSTCVSSGKTTSWFSEAVIVSVDGESQGRDDTWFRVVHPTINDQNIEYKIEASRDKKNWIVMSHVSINRISGQAVDWFIREHGGNSYQCHLEDKKI